MSEAFQRIAMAAAPIFLARGYSGVSLRALATELGIKAASLYYHCPDGKRQLYVRVLTTYLDNYRQRLQASRGRACFPNALFRLADWMLEHPPVDSPSVLQADLRPEDEAALTEALHTSVLVPFLEVLEHAKARHEVSRDVNTGLAAASIVALIHGLGFTHGEASQARRYVHAGIRLLLDGLRDRNP